MGDMADWVNDDTPDPEGWNEIRGGRRCFVVVPKPLMVKDCETEAEYEPEYILTPYITLKGWHGTLLDGGIWQPDW